MRALNEHDSVVRFDEGVQFARARWSRKSRLAALGSLPEAVPALCARQRTDRPTQRSLLSSMSCLLASARMSVCERRGRATCYLDATDCRDASIQDPDGYLTMVGASADRP